MHAAFQLVRGKMFKEFMSQFVIFYIYGLACRGPKYCFSAPQNFLNPSWLYDFHCVCFNQSDEYLQSPAQTWVECRPLRTRTIVSATPLDLDWRLSRMRRVTYGWLSNIALSNPLTRCLYKLRQINFRADSALPQKVCSD